MSKLLSIFLLTPLLVVFGKVNNSSPISTVAGGTINFNFSKQSDIDKFDLYTSYYSLPHFNGDSMYSYVYAEQKVILKNTYLTNYIIEADFGPAVLNGHIDMGFYLSALGAGPEVDHISAYNLQIKHDPQVDTWFLRLYEYENNVFKGTLKEVGNLPYWNSEWIHLSAVVNNGTISAYINNDYTNPILSYYVNDSFGLVGIRSFKCPAKVRNLSITAPEFQIDFSSLDKLINEYNNLDPNKYAPISWNKFESIFSNIKSQRSTLTNQLEINDAIKTLKEAKEELLLARTFDDLSKLIDDCRQITDESLYTQNSFASFKFCLERAMTLTVSSSIDEISSEYKMLLDRKNCLIKYGGSN